MFVLAKKPVYSKAFDSVSYNAIDDIAFPLPFLITNVKVSALPHSCKLIAPILVESPTITCAFEWKA